MLIEDKLDDASNIKASTEYLYYISLWTKMQISQQTFFPLDWSLLNFKTWFNEI